MYFNVLKNKQVKRVGVIAVMALSLGCAKTPSTTSHNGSQNSRNYDLHSSYPKSSIPLVMNDRVEYWISYFQGKGRPHFERYLRRSGKYVPMMRRILREEGMPEDLIYLAMIESGFNTQAYSHAKATGAWQFISSTGRRYGLDADQWHDERRDPEKATLAASRYLKDLYARYNDWYLAAAGYNAGEGKIDRAIRKYNTEDFWELTQGRYLKPETKDYVPKLIAAATIAKNLKKYGFEDIDYEKPVETVEVTLAKPLDLRVAAKCAEVDYEEIKALNPELIRWVTPVNSSEYKLKVPADVREKFEQNYAALNPDNHLGEDRIKVTKHQTLDKVAKKQGVSPILLAAANDMSPRQSVSPGTELIIPFSPPEGERLVDVVDKKGRKTKLSKKERRKLVRGASRGEVGSVSGDTRKAKKLAMIERNDAKRHSTHRVRSGESIGSIAKKFSLKPLSVLKEFLKTDLF